MSLLTPFVIVTIGTLLLPSPPLLEALPPGQDPGATVEDLVECVPCTGKGKLECQKCKGSGKVELKCEVCDKKGRIPCTGRGCEKGRRKCTPCNGQGFKRVRVTDSTGTYVEQRRCKSCRGSGKIDCRKCERGFRKCITCKGTRELLGRCRECHGRRRVACEACEGRGLSGIPELPLGLGEKLVSVEETIGTVRERIDALRDRHAALEDELTTPQAAIDEAEESITGTLALAPRDTSNELDALRAPVEAAHTTWRASVANHGENLTNLRESLKEAEAHLAELEKIEADIADLRRNHYRKSPQAAVGRVNEIGVAVQLEEAFCDKLDGLVAASRQSHENIATGLDATLSHVEKYKAELDTVEKARSKEREARERLGKAFTTLKKSLPDILAAREFPALECELVTDDLTSGELHVELSYLDREAGVSESLKALRPTVAYLEQIPDVITAAFDEADAVTTIDLVIEVEKLDELGHPERTPRQSFSFQRDEWKALLSGHFADDWRKLLSKSAPSPAFSGKAPGFSLSPAVIGFGIAGLCVLGALIVIVSRLMNKVSGAGRDPLPSEYRRF